MHLPPTLSHLLSNPPPTRKLYDTPPVVVEAPRWARLRAIIRRAVRR